MSELDLNNRPSDRRDNALADKILGDADRKAQDEELDRLYNDTVQPAAEDIKKLERLGFMSKASALEMVKPLEDRIKSMEERNEKLTKLLLKKANQGDNPVGRGTIDAPISEEEERYAKLEKEYGPQIAAYLKKPLIKR